ncbi:MAG: ABC-three component system protein [Lactobacillaceae bacterium]
MLKKIIPTDPFKVVQKIEDNLLLFDDIKEKVVRYYRFVQEQFRLLEGSSSNNFGIVASQIRTAYLKANASGISQEEVFNQLVSWLENINSEISSNIACQIIIAFFVQDCEVFDEISK